MSVKSLEEEKMTPKPGRTPKSAMKILGTLADDGPMCPIEISERLNMAPRTVSFALKELVRRQLLRRVPNLLDMRRPMYHVNLELATDLIQKYSDSAFRAHPSPVAWRQKA
jgi:DNA-binding MarR family transcriptional regulator